MTVIRGVHQWETLRRQTVLSWTETLHNKRVVRAAQKRKSLCEKKVRRKKGGNEHIDFFKNTRRANDFGYYHGFQFELKKALS